MTFSPLDSVLHGTLFASEEMRAVFSDRSRLAAMIRVEWALARAQASLGLVPAALAEAIAGIDIDSLDMAAIGNQAINAGVPVIPFVKAVGARLPSELEPYFHHGMTSQDVADTALVLQVRDALALIADDAQAAVRALADLAVRHRDAPCAGRTMVQHGAPVTFGYKAAVWCQGLTEVLAQLPALRERILVAELGGPVGTLSALGEHGPAVVEAFAAELGLSAPAISWHASRARIVETGVWLALLMGALAKFAADVIHLSSTEVGEVAEPAAFNRGGSSSLPHKRNPVSATIITACHAAAAGQTATLLSTMANIHERSPGLWHAEWHALPQLFGLASAAVREARRLAEGLQVHTERMKANLAITGGLLFTEAVASTLAELLGRDAAQGAVRRASEQVYAGQCASLREALGQALSDSPELAERLDRAFDLGPAIRAAGAWVDRVAAQTEPLHRQLAQTSIAERN